MISTKSEKTKSKKEELLNQKGQSLQRRVGLMSPFGRSNLGDLATQQAMIQNLQTFSPEIEISAFSLHPEDTEQRYKIPSFPITRLGETDEWWLGKQPNRLTTQLFKLIKALRSIPDSFLKKLLSPIFVVAALLLELFATFRAYQNIRGLDLLIISGGGQLDDYWWGARFHPYTLFLWSNLARLQKVRLAFVSVGAGPIDAQLSKFLIKHALSKADYRSYRDADSKSYIEQILSFKADDPIYPDLAHSLHIDSYRERSEPEDSRLIVGINPMTSYFDRQSETAYWDYLSKLAAFTAWLLHRKCSILLFPGCIDSDVPAMADLKSILVQNGVTYAAEQIIQEPIRTVNEQVAQLARTDIVVASRFHGVLMPLTLYKPVLALSYHPKIDMLMQDMGQASYCLSIYDFETETLKEKFTDVESKLKGIQAQLAKRVENYKTALNEQYEYLLRSF